MFNYHVDRKYELKWHIKLEEYLLRSDIKNHGKTDDYKYITSAIDHLNHVVEYENNLKRIRV